MKQWPRNRKKPLVFSVLVSSICKYVRKNYDLVQRGPSLTAYNGYTLGIDALACSLPPDEALTHEALAYTLESHGRDGLEVILTTAVQLGIEQGKRIERENSSSLRELFVKLLIARLDISKAEKKKLLRAFSRLN